HTCVFRYGAVSVRGPNPDIYDKPRIENDLTENCRAGRDVAQWLSHETETTHLGGSRLPGSAAGPGHVRRQERADTNNQTSDRPRDRATRTNIVGRHGTRAGADHRRHQVAGRGAAYQE